MQFLFAASIGAVVGATELIARYRDAPWRALRTTPSFLYICINLAAALIAMWAVLAFDINFGIPKDDPALETIRVLAAGFGAMAVFRMSVFSLRVNENDISVGPSLVLETLLIAADRAVDRALAQPRAAAVGEIMDGVSFEKAKLALPTHCFALMQNVSADEQQRFGLQIDSLAMADMTERAKVLNLGLALLNVVGEKVLQTAVGNLGDDIR